MATALKIAIMAELFGTLVITRFFFQIYTLEAKSKQAKENFATELRKVVQRQKEIQRSADQRTNGVQQQVRAHSILNL